MSEIQVRSSHPDATRVSLRLRAARVAVTRHAAWRWYAGFFHIGHDIVAEAAANGTPIKTAATDFKNRYYNPEFVSTLSQPELVFVVLHEIAHMLHRHNTTYSPAMKAAITRNDRVFIALAPRAIDYAVNSTIIDSPEWAAAGSKDLVARPEVALYDPAFRGMSWPQIYAVLKSRAEEDCCDSLDDHLTEAGEPADEDEQSFDTRLTREISAADARRRAGTAAKSDARTLLESSGTHVPWQQVFRHVLRSVMSKQQPRVSWSRPSRRAMSRQDLLPGPVPVRTLSSLVIVGDTSGSISDEELSDAVAQVIDITRATPPDKMHVLWVDAEVSSHQVFTNKDYGNIRSQLRPTGGGGTDMRTAMEYVAQEELHPSAMVVLTDGYTPFPEPHENFGYPVWWLITTSHITSPHGVTIRV